ncbi:MAG: hypothetical protein QM756_34020 [Polyangiaceae bacterium]
MAQASSLTPDPAAVVVLEFPSPLEALTHIRSTLVTSSLASLRARGLFERYDALQRSVHRETILSSVAGSWLDLEVAQAHYWACDALGLSPAQQIDIGKDVSRRIHETFMRTVVQMARGIGVTPWLLLGKGNSMVARLMRGGGTRVTRLAPKVARVELARHALLDIPYFMNAMFGVYQAAVELLASDVSVRLQRAESMRPEQLTVLRIDWR